MSRSFKILSDNPNPRRIYGRRLGRPLGKQRAEALDTLLPRFSVPVELLTGERDLDPSLLFPSPKKQICFEIGFGSGEHLLALLRQYPETGFLGAEPFINGMAGFLKDIAEESPNNIRVLMDDAMLIARSLKDKTLDKIYVLNPDPWPKKRHHKRRIISAQNLDEFARILKPGGEIVMATDVDELGEWMKEQCSQHAQFQLRSESQPEEWIETRYAFKGKQAGRKQTFLIFERR